MVSQEFLDSLDEEMIDYITFESPHCRELFIRRYPKMLKGLMQYRQHLKDKKRAK